MLNVAHMLSMKFYFTLGRLLLQQKPTPSRARIYNRHGVFDTNRLRLIIDTPLLAN